VSELLIDPLQVARDMQWDIENVNDPVEASIIASNALRLIGPADSDKRFMPGRPLTIKALGGYVFHKATQETKRQVSKYDGFEVNCVFGGIGFIQNYDDPELQTLYLDARNAKVAQLNGLLRSQEALTHLVIPVLMVEDVKLAA
jgi:hypothetical protein